MLSSLYYDASKYSLYPGSLDTLRGAKLNSIRTVEDNKKLSSPAGLPEDRFLIRRHVKTENSAHSVEYHEELKNISPAVQSSSPVLREERMHPTEVDKPVKLKKFTSLAAKNDCSRISEALNGVLGEIPRADASIESSVLVEKREQFLSALFGRDCKLFFPPFFTREYISDLVNPENESFIEKYYYSLNKLKWRNYAMEQN